jgi:hypothetical protein
MTTPLRIDAQELIDARCGPLSARGAERHFRWLELHREAQAVESPSMEVIKKTAEIEQLRELMKSARLSSAVALAGIEKAEEELRELQQPRVDRQERDLAKIVRKLLWSAIFRSGLVPG